MKRLLLSMVFVVLGILLLTEGVLAEEGGAAGPDTFARITQPDTNFDVQYLSVAASTSACNPTDITYVYWDLTGITNTAVVHIASLTLTTNYASGTDGVILGLYAVESGWHEETLTWATAPALGALIETRPAPTAAGQPVTFNSAALIAYLNSKVRSGADHASFALRFTEGCSLFALARFDDRDSGLASPTMHLEYEIYVPDLTIYKTGPAVTYPGDVITYTLAYSNIGIAIAPYINIVDVLPLEMTVHDSGGAIVLPQPDNTLRWEVFDLAPGDSGVLTFTAIISPTFSGILMNTATITTTAVESDTTNNVSPPVVTEVLAPDLAIHKSGPTIASPGDVIEYTLVYTNIGNAPAPYVTITDALPPQTTVYDHSGRVILPLPGQTLTWEVVNLAPGDSGVITITVIVNPTFTGLVTNTATITTTIFDSNTTNNVSLPAVTEIRAPDLAIHKRGPATAYPGELIEYTLIYTNVGDAPAPYITITDVLPPQLTVYDHTGTVLQPLPGHTLTWEVFNLAPGDSGVLTITALVSPTFTGLLTNTASIATPIFDSDVTNNVTPPVVTEIRAPDLAIHKTGPATAYPGDVIEYTLVYTNVGDAPAPYVTITDLLPANTQLYDHTGTVILPRPAEQLTWEIFNLAPNAGGTLTVSVIISPTFTGWLTNTVTIATTAPEIYVNNNVNAAWTLVGPHLIYLPLVMRLFR